MSNSHDNRVQRTARANARPLKTRSMTGALVLFAICLGACGNSSPARQATDQGDGGGGGTAAVQHVMIVVTGDPTSGIGQIESDVDVAYNSQEVQTSTGGECMFQYDRNGANTRVPDSTLIECTASIALPTPPDAGSATFPGVIPNVNFYMVLKGQLAPPVDVNASSPLLLFFSAGIQSPYVIWSAGISKTSSLTTSLPPPPDFSFTIDSAQMLPLPYPTDPLPVYLIHGEGQVTLPASDIAPGAVTIAITIS